MRRLYQGKENITLKNVSRHTFIKLAKEILVVAFYLCYIIEDIKGKIFIFYVSISKERW